MHADEIGSGRDTFIELGSSGLRRSGGTINEEFLANLQGVKGFKVYREMRDNDPVIGAMLYAIDKVITRLEWKIEGDDVPQACICGDGPDCD